MKTIVLFQSKNIDGIYLGQNNRFCGKTQDGFKKRRSFFRKRDVDREKDFLREKRKGIAEWKRVIREICDFNKISKQN